LTDGGGGLTKLGSGILILTNDSTYSGATTVSNGTLEVDGSLSVSPVTVRSGATLSGIGTLSGTVTLDDGSTLAPGTNAPGTLTVDGNLALSGSLLIAVDKGLAQSNSMTTVSGTLSNTGTGVVVVTNLGPDLVVGDSFQLFNQPLVNGNALNIPASGGVTWTNKLAEDGTIQVLSVAPPINPLPGVVQFNVSGNMLELSWPTNRGWILQTQTNTLSTGLNTNWVNVPGSDGVTNMSFNVDTTQGAIFYRMVHP
jgi:autotransporter-associated beta strand protein